MSDTKEFVITEAAFRAVIETVANQNAALQEFAAQVAAQQEALVILHHEVNDLRDSLKEPHLHTI